jgi:alpha 1,2-mannosyltransferase
LLSVTHDDYKSATSINRLKSWSASGPPYKNTIPPGPANSTRRANAAFVVLARNGDLAGILQSIKQMEDRFNKKYKYPYVFLNEEPFSEEFKKWVDSIQDGSAVLTFLLLRWTTEVVGSETIYGQIPHDHWYQPSWIDEDKATKARLKMIEEKVIYGHSVPYRNMCRFNSGVSILPRNPYAQLFQYSNASFCRSSSSSTSSSRSMTITGALSKISVSRIPVIQMVNRFVRPDVKFFCDLDYDPFLVMQDGNKVYGFTVSLYEYPATIPTLWDATKGTPTLTLWSIQN